MCEATAPANVDEIGCFWTVGESETEQQGGPLAGVAVGVKDSFDVAGLPRSLGIPRLAAHGSSDAAAVARLRGAGAVVAGKTAMDQLAWTMTGQAPGFPACRNPHDRARMPGGSSSGSAVAVAAGIVPIAIGTDAGGSVRVPAAWCGVVGFKPSFGAIPLDGCAPMAPSFDTVGVFARSVAECAKAASVLADDRSYDLELRPAGVRIGVPTAMVATSALVVQRAFRSALTRWATAEVTFVEVTLGWPRRLLAPLYAREFAAAWGDIVDETPELFAPEVRLGVVAGRDTDSSTYGAAKAALIRARDEALARTDRIDVVACPTTPMLPPRLGDPDPTLVAGRNARPFNGLGWPAISLPCGSVDGLPVGLQLAAPPGRDRLLLSVAADIEAVLRDHDESRGG